MLAAESGNREIVQMLVEAGADIDCRVTKREREKARRAKYTDSSDEYSDVERAPPEVWTGSMDVRE